MTRIKTQLQYEQVFEDLMQYTRFTNVTQIKKPKDLFDFFGDLKRDAVKRKRKFNPLNPPMRDFRKEMGGALGRLQERRPKKILSIRSRVLESTRPFKTFEDAQSQRLVAINVDNIPVFRSRVVIRKKTILVFRDKLGRFARPIKEVETKAR